MQLLAGQWDLDLETRQLVLCPRSRAMLGITPDSAAPLTEEDWIRSVHPDDVVTARQKMEAAVRGEEPYLGQYRAVLPDGSMRPILSLGKAVPDGHSTPRRFNGFNIDLSSAAPVEPAERPRDMQEVYVLPVWERLASNQNGQIPICLTSRDIQDARRLLSLLAEESQPRVDTVREVLLTRARTTLAVRRSRERLFNRAMLTGPAFDLLVALYAIDDGEVPSVKRLAELTGVPHTTAIRWLQYLAIKGYLSRERGGSDGRTSVALLTEKGRATLDEFFMTLGGDA